MMLLQSHWIQISCYLRREWAHALEINSTHTHQAKYKGSIDITILTINNCLQYKF